MPSAVLVAALLFAVAESARSGTPNRPAPVGFQKRPAMSARIANRMKLRSDVAAEAVFDPSICTDPACWFAHFDLAGQKLTEEEMKIVNVSTASILKNFPGAMSSQQLVERIEAKLIEYGFNQETTLFGASLCPDEICHEPNDLPDLLAKRYSPGGAAGFSLSGLGGVPFTGKTGFAAFSHHVPKDGQVLILFAPHVAISPNGEVGRYKREGQEGLSTACGACIGALNAVEAENGPTASSGNIPHSDYQMETIIQHVRERFAAIGVHPSGKMVGLILEVYELARERMLAIVDLGQLKGGGHNTRCAILGGVQINMPAPMQDFFLPLSFEMHRERKPVVDLLPSILPELASLDLTEPTRAAARAAWGLKPLHAADGDEPTRAQQVVAHLRDNHKDHDVTRAAKRGTMSVKYGRRLGQASVDPAAWAAHLELTGFTPSDRERAILERATRTVRESFPGAVVSEALCSKLERVLARFDFHQENTLFASSLCPDEICHESEVDTTTTIVVGYFYDSCEFHGFTERLPDTKKKSGCTTPLCLVARPFVGLASLDRDESLTNVSTPRRGTRFGRWAPSRTATPARAAWWLLPAKGHHDLCRGHPGSSRTISSAAGDGRRRQTAESLAWAPECPPAPVFLNTIQVARMSLTFFSLCVVVLVQMPIKTATR